MEFQSQMAIWMQIAHQIATRIMADEWSQGERIPSVRAYASDVQVNPNTVVRSFNYLQEEGVIYNKRGVGYFVAADGVQRARALRKKAFTEEVLPVFFQMIQELGISIEEVGQMYQRAKK